MGNGDGSDGYGNEGGGDGNGSNTHDGNGNKGWQAMNRAMTTATKRAIVTVAK